MMEEIERFKPNAMSKEFQRDVREAFKLFDTTSTGVIDAKDLKIAMRALGFEPETEEISKMIAETDIDNSGYLSFNNFLTLMAGKMALKDKKRRIT